MKFPVVISGHMPLISCVAALLCVLGRAAQADSPLPSGTLAYLHDGAVFVCPAGETGGGAHSVPRSKGAISFSMSQSVDGAIVFFAPRSNSRGPGGGSGPEFGAFFSRPPYSDSDALPLYVGKGDDITVSWDADGAAEVRVGDLQTRRIDGKTGKMTVVAGESGKAHGIARHDGATSSSDISVYTDGDRRVMMTKIPGGPETVLFTPRAPDSMFAAVHRAKNPANLKQLSDEIDESLWKDPRNWSVSPPALTSDRRSAFFASNLGTGMGAQGNTFFCLFAADIATSRLAVLSKAGTFFGRVPTDMSVSADDNRLFMTTSSHSSAADNSFSGYVIDLQTQQTREIIRSDPAHPNDANVTSGWCWSPDGHFLAISILYYNEKAIRDDKDPDLNEATLYIKDAASGRIVRQVPHAQMPEWSK